MMYEKRLGRLLLRPTKHCAEDRLTMSRAACASSLVSRTRRLFCWRQRSNRRDQNPSSRAWRDHNGCSPLSESAHGSTRPPPNRKVRSTSRRAASSSSSLQGLEAWKPSSLIFFWNDEDHRTPPIRSSLSKRVVGENLRQKYAIEAVLLAHRLFRPPQQRRIRERNRHPIDCDDVHHAAGLVVLDSACRFHQIDDDFIRNTHDDIVVQIVVGHVAHGAVRQLHERGLHALDILGARVDEEIDVLGRADETGLDDG